MVKKIRIRETRTYEYEVDYDNYSYEEAGIKEGEIDKAADLDLKEILAGVISPTDVGTEIEEQYQIHMEVFDDEYA